MKGVILHGGYGTRLRPFTQTMPKQLLPIGNKPISQYCLENLRDAGIKDIAIIIGGPNSNKVKEYYGDGSKFDVNITYIYQDSPKGISHAIGLCEKFIQDQKFVVFLGDNILKKNILNIKENFQNSDAEANILLSKVENPTQFGIAYIKDGIIKKIVEKPKNPPSDFAVIGIYFLAPTIFDIIKRLKPSWRNELEITDALQMLLDDGHKIHYNIITEFWKDTGTPSDIINANKAILEDRKPYFHGIEQGKVTRDEKIMIGKRTILEDGVRIIEPVIIGKNCIVHSGVCIGPNVSIGNNCEILKSKINNSIIMSGCKIDHDGVISNSIIAYNSEITTNDNENKVFFVGEDSKIL